MAVIANGAAARHIHTQHFELGFSLSLRYHSLSLTHSETTMRFFHLCRARTETAHVLSRLFPKLRVALGGVGGEVYRLWQPQWFFSLCISEILRNNMELRTNE